MPYLISFLEGVITFVSPCLLPLLPVYISYFAGGGAGENEKKTACNAVGFILGFTIVFVSMGAFAGLLGGLLRRYQTVVNLVTGAIVVLFGFNYLGIVKIRFLQKTHSWGGESGSDFYSSILMGLVFSISWTPCVGAFLGSALMLASQKGSIAKGIVMLLCYSIGLGIPFLLSAILIGKVKMSFRFVKKHYNIITKLSGVFLIVVGVFMMTGLLGWFLSMLTF